MLTSENRLHLPHKTRGCPWLHVFEKPESSKIDALRRRLSGSLAAEAFKHERVEPRVQAVTTEVQVFAEQAFEAGRGKVFQNGNCLSLFRKRQRAGRFAFLQNVCHRLARRTDFLSEVAEPVGDQAKLVLNAERLHQRLERPLNQVLVIQSRGCKFGALIG